MAVVRPGKQKPAGSRDRLCCYRRLSGFSCRPQTPELETGVGAELKPNTPTGRAPCYPSPDALTVPRPLVSQPAAERWAPLPGGEEREVGWADRGRKKPSWHPHHSPGPRGPQLTAHWDPGGC